ncbi:Mut7-C RNAse domain-containing protein [Hydrogenimonas urashimensis]|uniref:Mut7-C RNAse domain-containing protein n=1 Tax=Hydrogenimonas urashimensis TaxID=2740515 RepID=UPI0019169361|nr:Mut7-C RNAse domain-containing protein [Hydrogenimonas urashimensis]
MKPGMVWRMPYRFVCDVHLAKVAKYLRLLGFDTVYRNDMTDNELLGMCRFGRIGLTCDRRLQIRSPHTVVLLFCGDATRQVQRLSAMLDLPRYAHPFHRSLCCNRKMVPCDKRRRLHAVPKETYRWLEGFWECPKCKKVYWQGTHAGRMRQKIVQLLGVSENVLDIGR